MKKNATEARDLVLPDAEPKKASGVFPIDRVTSRRDEAIRPMSIAERHATFLRAVLPRYGPIEPDMWPALLPLIRIVRLERGAHFLKAGDVAHSFGFIVRGLVREYYVSSNGREHNRAFCWEGTPFGSLVDLISTEPPMTYIEVIEDIEALVMTWSDFEALCAREPRFHVFARRVTELLLVTKIRREHDLLMLDAEERYARVLAASPGIETRVPLYHLASYLGIRHEHLSRIRRKRAQSEAR